LLARIVGTIWATNKESKSPSSKLLNLKCTMMILLSLNFRNVMQQLKKERKEDKSVVGFITEELGSLIGQS